jgi:phage antirepressor YoqD-like protein
VDQPKQKSTTPTMAPKKTKKEQAAHRKVALQKKLAAQQSKVMDPKVSLHDGDGNDDSTSGIEETAEAGGQTTDDEEGRSNPTRIRNENLHLLLVSSHICIPNGPKSSYHQRKATSKGRRCRIMRKTKSSRTRYQ